jgi:chemosensory pili system protein ChpA (sensor histidine kinase/response regulator)
MLAEEMEQTCRRLARPRSRASPTGPGADARGAAARVPQRLLSGGKDVALALLPLLNDLRQARDKPTLSEGTLVLLNAGPFERHPQNRSGSAPAADVARGFEKVAHRLRPSFQAALLGWIRGGQVGRHLEELLRVSTALERAAGSEQVQQLWSVLAAVFTAIRAGGLEPTVTLKRLIGQADRQLKRLIDGGESALVSAPPVDLVNSLLYYVGRAESNDPRILKLRETYGLAGDVAGRAARAGRERTSPARASSSCARWLKRSGGSRGRQDVLDIFCARACRTSASSSRSSRC